MPRKITGKRCRKRLDGFRRHGVAIFAEWFDSQIENIYNQYLSGDKFATDTSDGTEGFGRHGKLTPTTPQNGEIFADEILG